MLGTHVISDNLHKALPGHITSYCLGVHAFMNVYIISQNARGGSFHQPQRHAITTKCLQSKMSQRCDMTNVLRSGPLDVRGEQECALRSDSATSHRLPALLINHCVPRSGAFPAQSASQAAQDGTWQS
jgi:hypothetical protein